MEHTNEYYGLKYCKLRWHIALHDLSGTEKRLILALEMKRRKRLIYSLQTWRRPTETKKKLMSALKSDKNSRPTPIASRNRQRLFHLSAFVWMTIHLLGDTNLLISSYEVEALDAINFLFSAIRLLEVPISCLDYKLVST